MPLLTAAPSGTPGAVVTSLDAVANPTTLQPPMSTGHAVGDTLLLFTCCRSPTPTVATPTGWTQLLNVAGANGRLALFALKVTTGSEAVPSVVWSGLTAGTAGTPVQARIAAFRNLNNDDLTAMIDVVGAVADGSASTSSSNAGGAVTTVAERDLVIALTTRQEPTGSILAASGFTSISASMGTTSGADFAMAWSYQVKDDASAGAASNFTLSGAQSATSSGVKIALKARAAVVTSYSQEVLATAGVLGYWRMGDGSGSFLDSSGNAIHASTVAGGITRQVAGLIQNDIDQAVRGDGAVGTYISVPYSSVMNTALASFECWVKIESFVSGRVILRRGTTSIAMTGTNALVWRITDSGANSVTVTSGSNVVKPGQRQHIAAVFGGGSAGMRLYVDGVNVGGAPSFTPTAALATDTTNAFNMLANDVATAGMQGTLDEVVLYNRALLTSEVVEHNALGATTSNSDAASGAIPISGSCVDAWKIYAQSHTPSGSIPIFGTSVDAYSGRTIRSDFPTGTLAITGSVLHTGSSIAWGYGIRELAPLRHHIDAIAPNGRHFRWAHDEPRAENVFSGLRWGSTMPGGYESCDCVLPRKPGVDYADLERLSTLRVIGVGGKVVGEYRLERSPQTSGDQMSVSPSAVGWQAHLSDNKSVNIIFIDREHGGWVSANSQRRLAELNGNTDPIDSRSTQAEDGLPSLILGTQGAWARRFNCEMYYHMPPGEAVGRIKFDFQAAASVNVVGDANWVGDLFTVTDDGYSAFTQLTPPSDWLSAASGSVDVSAAAVALANRRAAMVRVYYATGPAGADNTQYDVFLRFPRVYGNHDLVPRGSSSQTEGFIASDMIAFALRKYAPMLQVAPVPPTPAAGQPYTPPFTEWIQQTNFVIPQAAFTDTTLTEIVNQLTRFGLEDWAVWNDRIFYLSPRNGSPHVRKWRARIGPAKLEATGKQVDRLWESIIVQFNDVDGSQMTVGPPGSGADVESPYLKDTDPDNPANILGITRRDKLVMGASTVDAAIQVGMRFLEEQKLIDRSGRATLVGHVEDNHGVLFPYSEVQAGDIITFVDAADASYRRIVKADHDDAAKSVSVDLDAPPEGLQAVLERLAVVLVPLGL